MLVQEAGHRQGAVLMLLHPQREGGQAPVDEPGVERAHGAPEMYQHPLAYPVDAFAGSHHHPAEGVAVPAQVLGHAVEDEVRAEGQRLLKDRRGEGAVDDERRAGPVRDVGQGGDVGQAKDGVGGGLDVHELGVASQGPAHGLSVAGVHQAHLHAVAAGV